MSTLVSSYTRMDAIAEGRLLDVSHLNCPRLNPYPTFVSAGLWEACRRERPFRRWGMYRRPRYPRRDSHEDRVRDLVTLPPLFRWLERGRCGEFTVCVDAVRWLCKPLALRVVIEPEEDYGRIVTVLHEGERLAFDVPRPPLGGSFFVM